MVQALLTESFIIIRLSAKSLCLGRGDICRTTERREPKSYKKTLFFAFLYDLFTNSVASFAIIEKMELLEEVFL